MANRIYITHSDQVTLQEAIETIQVGLANDLLEPGVVVVRPNGLVVYYNDKTKNPSFEVWRRTRK